MSYLLDTNALTDWITKDAHFIKQIQTKNPSKRAISAMTEHEVLFGIACNPKSRLRKAVESILCLLPKLAIGFNEAALAADIRADLKFRGLPIGPHDLLIAADCCWCARQGLDHHHHPQHQKIQPHARLADGGPAVVSFNLRLWFAAETRRLQSLHEFFTARPKPAFPH